MISFCTVSYNRTHHIKQTLKENIEIAKDHQFVLLNYGYDKELDDYIESEFKGVFNLIYKIYESNKWNISRGKNITHTIGTGEILFCLDADTYILEQGLEDIEKRFKRGFYFSHPYTPTTPLAMWREDFYRVGGWNEDIKERGEDMDMARRLNTMGILPYMSSDSSRIIKHIYHD